MCLHITTVLPLPLEHQTCAAAAWHSSVRVSSGQHLSLSPSSWQAVALCHPEKNAQDLSFHHLHLNEAEHEVADFCFRQSDLLLSGLVGHFDVGETLSTACRISHTCNLQQAFPLHGRNEGSGCVPRSCPHLGYVRQDQHGLKPGALNFIMKKLCDQYLIINLHLEVLFILLLWSKEGFLTISSILKRQK